MQRIIVLLEKLSDERIREVYDFTLFISSREANTPDDKHWDDLLAKTPQTLVDRFVAEATAAHANGSAIEMFDRNGEWIGGE